MAPVRRRHAAGVALVALACAVILAACSSGGSGTSKNNASGTVTLNFVGTDDPSIYKDAIKSFEGRYPKITVHYSSIPFGSYNAVMEQRLGAKDSSIDVYEVDQPRVSALAAQGFLANLNSLKTQLQATAIPGQYDVNLYHGSLYALPLWTSTEVLFYNKTLLKKAHIAAPSADPTKSWTWEQVGAAAKKAQQAGAKYGWTPEQIDEYYEIQPYAESAGGGSGVTGTEGLTPDFTNAGWLRAMNWYHDQFTSGIAPRGVNDDQTSPLFQEGKVAFMTAGFWNFAALSKVDYGMAPYPHFAGGKTVTPDGSYSIGVTPWTPHKAAALDFVKYLTLNTQGSIQAGTASQSIPSNKYALQSYITEMSGLPKAVQAADGKIMNYQLAHTGVARPRTVGYLQLELVMTQAIENIVNGESAATALKKADTQLQSAWAQLK